MPRRIRDRLTYANVTATLALFIALGGSSYAALKLPRNSVGSQQIRTGAVASSEVKDRSLQLQDISKPTRASLAGKNFTRALDCQKLMAQVTGRPAIPQAGLVVTDKFVGRYGEPAVAALQAALERAVQAVLRDPQAAAATAAAALELPKPMIERSIPFSNLVVRSASAARADLTALFDVLAKEDPRIIGGRQPDDRFYAL